MAKEKKIGIRFYLNERLNPNVVEGENRYPVYAQITFNRKTFQCYFPLLYFDGYLSEPEFEKFIEKREDSRINEQLSSFEEKIRLIIKIEFDNLGEKFSLKGLSDRLSKYEQPLLSFLEKYVKVNLIKALSSSLSIEEAEALKNELFSLWDLYSVIDKSYPDQLKKVLNGKLKSELSAFVYLSGFLGKDDMEEDNHHYPTAFDWFKTDLANTFKNFLLKHTPIESKEQKKSLGFFKNESLDSPVWRLFFSLNVHPIDISLIISEINKSIFG